MPDEYNALKVLISALGQDWRGTTLMMFVVEVKGIRMLLLALGVARIWIGC